MHIAMKSLRLVIGLLSLVFVLAFGAWAANYPSPTFLTALFTDSTVNSTIGYDTGASFSPHELVISGAIPGQNSLQLRNTSPAGFSALSFRGTNPWDSNPSAMYERGAIGWSNAGIFAIEMSSFDNTYDAGKPPARGSIQQSGAVDPTGGTVLYCTLTQGSKTITCPSAVPSGGFTYVFSFNLPTGTVLTAGAGTTTPTLSQAALYNQTNALVRFWTPTWAQRNVFDFSNDDLVNVNNWDLSLNTSWSRVSHTFQVAGGMKFAARQIAAGASDTATIRDHFINWSSSTASAKTEAIPACSPQIAGLELIIVDEGGTAGTYSITITPASGQIKYAASLVINTAGGSARLECDGVQNWVPF